LLYRRKFDIEAAIYTKSQSEDEFDSSEQQDVQALKLREMEVKQHEQAHLTAAGQYARGGPTYEYKIGPDGQRYVLGGEVQIDTSPISDDPEATTEKARAIKKAAMAPTAKQTQEQKGYNKNGQATPTDQFSPILDLVV